MTSMHSSMVLGRLRGYESRLISASRVLSRGILIGTSLIASAFRHEDAFYRHLNLCTFAISALVYNALNWEAVVRYLFLALVTVALPILLMLPHSDITVLFLLDRSPILIMLISVFIEEYSSRFTPNIPYQRRALATELGLTDTDFDGVGHWFSSMPNNRDEFLAHMNGGEREPYRVPSQVSSDISLPNSPGTLPSSCDSIIRSFWPEKSGRPG
ncbi:hypothetical protein GGS26DRAFT_58308 [Hypomontagnella submonticulosa]|nr:hypothetical protein GGS26DRAFT_58308 [Hypomontagnella submonticulosa]